MSRDLITRLLPFLNWPRMNRDLLAADLAAGIAVSLLAIPQAMAYAQLAGVPAYYGLYAALIPSVVAVLFGSSPILSTGPVALTSLLTAASVGRLAAPGTADFVSYVTLLALLSGLFQIGLGLARAGVLVNLLSHPVLMGFINAAALIIALSQLSAVTGITVAPTDSFLNDIWHILVQAEQAHPRTLALAALAIVILIGFRRLAPRLPGVLIMVAILTGLSFATAYADHGGKVVGDIPAGLPALSVPAMSWSATMELLPAAFIVALISFMEAMSSCKVIAIKTRSRWDENLELVGQGLAKVAAAFCDSMPVSGSFSRSALNLSMRAKTGFSALFAAAFVLLTLLFLTPLFYHLPKPALAAMIIMAVVNLFDPGAMRRAWAASRDDGIAAVLTFVATLAFAPNIQNGILAGILFSLGAFIYRRMMPRAVAVALRADRSLLAAEEQGLPPVNERICALRFDAALFFGNVSYFEDAIVKLERDNPQLAAVLVVASGINQLDATAVDMLRRVVARLRESGVTLAVSGARRQFLEVAEHTGLAAAIGEDNLFPTADQAVQALFARLAPPASPA